MAGPAAWLAHLAVLAAALGPEADRGRLLRAGRGAAAGRLTARGASKRSSRRSTRSYLVKKGLRTGKAMPATKHRRRGKARPRHQMLHLAMPPRHRITEEDRREDALLEARLHQL